MTAKVVGGPIHPDLARFNVRVADTLYTNVAIVESKQAGCVILETAKGYQYRVGEKAIVSKVPVTA